MLEVVEVGHEDIVSLILFRRANIYNEAVINHLLANVPFLEHIFIKLLDRLKVSILLLFFGETKIACLSLLYAVFFVGKSYTKILMAFRFCQIYRF